MADAKVIELHPDQEAPPQPLQPGGPIQRTDDTPISSSATALAPAAHAPSVAELEADLTHSRERLVGAMRRLWSHPTPEAIPAEHMRELLGRTADLHAQIRVLTASYTTDATAPAAIAELRRATEVLASDVATVVRGSTEPTPAFNWKPWAIGGAVVLVAGGIGVGVWAFLRHRKKKAAEAAKRKRRPILGRAARRASEPKTPPPPVARRPKPKKRVIPRKKPPVSPIPAP